MPNVLSGRFRAGSPALSGLLRQVSAYRIPQSCNLGGMSMNIQRKNSAHHFRMQSEREQTLVNGFSVIIIIIIIKHFFTRYHSGSLYW